MIEINDTALDTSDTIERAVELGILDDERACTVPKNGIVVKRDKPFVVVNGTQTNRDMTEILRRSPGEVCALSSMTAAVG